MYVLCLPLCLPLSLEQPVAVATVVVGAAAFRSEPVREYSSGRRTTLAAPDRQSLDALIVARAIVLYRHHRSPPVSGSATRSARARGQPWGGVREGRNDR